MDVILTHKPFDRIESPIASVPVFSDRFPLKQAAGLIDWRLNGRVSRLVDKQRLVGSMGDCLIMPTDGRLKAETVMFFGLGPSHLWQSSRAESHFLPWIEKLEGLKQESWLVSMAGLTDDFLQWRQYLRIFVHAVAHRSQAACRQLFLSEPAPWVLEAKKRHMDFGEGLNLSFDLSPA
jgi:hypothetical protein